MRSLLALFLGATLALASRDNPLAAQEPAPPATPSALAAYRAWLHDAAANPVRAAIVYHTQAAEAERISAALKSRGIASSLLKRDELPKADFSRIEILVIAPDTQTGSWRDPWGTDEQARALVQAHKPLLGIGEGGLCSFGRLNLPVCGGRTMHSSGDSAARSHPEHAFFKAPHDLSGAPAITVYSRRLGTQPAHRSSFNAGVIPLCIDPASSRDYAIILFQRADAPQGAAAPCAAYWGFEGSFADLTEQGKDLLDNLCRWTVWASRQADVALLHQSVVQRADPLRRGDGTIDLTLTRADGSLARATPFRLEVYDAVNGKGWAPFADGKTDGQGHAVLTGLTGGPEAERYRIAVQGAAVPALEISLIDGPQRRAMDARIPPVVGDKAPDLPLRDILAGKEMRLSEFRGRVVFIDFWATWCGPCQEPMQHNNQISRDKAATWKDRAVIIGISIDTDGDKLKNHITTREWTAMPQLWVPLREGKPAAGAGAVFGFVGIPTSFLIDAEGTIRWRGHPAEVDAAAEIQKILDATHPAQGK